MQKPKEIDIDILPVEVKRELLDFYEYLVNKYYKDNIRNGNLSERKKSFFKLIEKYSFKLPKGYKFNREELHER